MDGIAAAFIKAILQFCHHPTLCYKWPSFLPSAGDFGPFWSGLVQRIEQLIREKPIIKSRHGGDVHKISEVRIPAKVILNEEGDSLFDDSTRDPLISKAYSSESTTLLKSFGLCVTTWDTILSLLRDDLESATSKIKSASTSEESHSRVAKLLSICFSQRYYSIIPILRQLPILPLRNGVWASPDRGPVYMPTTRGIPIPPGVAMQILDTAAVANHDRKVLFNHLGATEASTAAVRSAILQCYGSLHPLSVGSMAESKAHLQYLYLTKTLFTWDDFSLVCVYSRSNNRVKPRRTDVYLSNNESYGPEAMLGPTKDAPGLDAIFLHPAYLEDPPAKPDISYQDWTTWLMARLGIHGRVNIISSKKDALSDAWYYVTRHRPSKLLGMLQHVWEYEWLNLSNESIARAIQKTIADELCISKPSSSCTLDGTYLPLPSLRKQCQRFMPDPDRFPFLNLEGEPDSTEFLKKWMFLSATFGVGKDENIQFFLDILKSIACSNSETLSFDKLQSLYVSIDEKSKGVTDQKMQKIVK